MILSGRPSGACVTTSPCIDEASKNPSAEHAAAEEFVMPVIEQIRRVDFSAPAVLELHARRSVDDGIGRHAAYKDARVPIEGVHRAEGARHVEARTAVR